MAPATVQELNHFIATYPHDPRTPKARLLAAQLGNLERQLGMAGAPSVEAVTGQFDAISADTSLPEAVRAQAGVMAVNTVMQSAREKSDPAVYDTIEKRIEAYQKQFGDVMLNGKVSGVAVLREEQMGMLKMANDPARYDALLAKLATDANPQVAEMAKKAQAEEAATADLKTKPMDLSFTSLDGKPVDLAKLRGKVVLIDFWATWCPPCRGETPNVVAAYQKYHDKGFDIIGISLDQDQDALQKYITENHMTWPQYFDGKGWDNAISSRFGIQSIPAMWLVGKDGKLVTQDGRDDLDGQVAKLLAAP